MQFKTITSKNKHLSVAQTKPTLTCNSELQLVKNKHLSLAQNKSTVTGSKQTHQNHWLVYSVLIY